VTCSGAAPPDSKTASKNAKRRANRKKTLDSENGSTQGDQDGSAASVDAAATGEPRVKSINMKQRFMGQLSRYVQRLFMDELSMAFPLGGVFTSSLLIVLM
jgi:hypothetical protein